MQINWHGSDSNKHLNVYRAQDNRANEAMLGELLANNCRRARQFDNKRRR